MNDIEKERERLAKLDQQIDKARDKAEEIIEPHATVEGGPGTMGDE